MRLVHLTKKLGLPEQKAYPIQSHYLKWLGDIFGFYELVSDDMNVARISLCGHRTFTNTNHNAI